MYSFIKSENFSLKKTFAIAFFASTACMPAIADTIEIDGLTWRYSIHDANAKKITLGLGGATHQNNVPDGTRAISALTSVDASKIPWTIKIGNETYTVTKIADFAFHGCEKLTGTLAIPDAVTVIGKSAFGWCTSLTGFSGANGVTQWGAYVFQSCTNMKGEFPAFNVIEEGLFYECPEMTGTLKLASSISSIPRFTFAHWSITGGAVIPENVITIGTDSQHGVFQNCLNLEGIWVKGPKTAKEQSYTTVRCRNLAASSTSIKMILMGRNTIGGNATHATEHMLNGVSGAKVLVPDNGKWNGLVVGGSNNEVRYYGPNRDFDLSIDDVAMTATFTPFNETGLSCSISYVPLLKKNFNLDTIISITNSMEISEGVAITDSALLYVKFPVKNQAQLDNVLAAVKGDVPIVIDATGIEERVVIPEGRKVAVIAEGGMYFGKKRNGLAISIH